MKVASTVFFSLLHLTTEFVIPPISIEIFNTAMRVSIPDVTGIRFFSFHAKIGQPFKNNETGKISGNGTELTHGRWYYRNFNIQLKLNDIIYYWISIRHLNGNYTHMYNTRSRNSTCTVSTTYVNTARVCKGEFIMYEKFDYFNNNIWLQEYRFAGKPDYEFVAYTLRRDILNISGGYLKIRPVTFGDSYVTAEGERDLGIRCTGVQGTTDCIQKADAFLIRPPVGSAQITTRTKWTFQYGRIDIRAKLPKGDWIYPQLFLNPANEVYGPDYASGQIRIAFVEGNAKMNHILQGGCIIGNSRAGRHYLMRTTRRNKAWSDGFHVFSVLWKPGIISVSVDGEIYANIYPPEKGFAHEASYLNLGDVHKWHYGTKFAPFDQPMNVVIGVGVGGRSFEDYKDGTKPWNNNDPKGQKKFYEAESTWKKTWTNRTLYVDYIKIQSI